MRGLRALKKLGYQGKVFEVPIGVGTDGKQIRGDRMGAP